MNKINSLPKDFLRFISAVAIFGFAMAVVNAVFNNFLSETFTLGDFRRGMLELPRELPGFLVIFVSALLFYMCNRRLAVLSHILAAAGIYLVGHFSTTYALMLIWLFVFSMGQHIFLPLTQSIGMEFADKGKTGKRLGQLTGATNFAAIIGSFVVFIGFKFLNFTFSVSFTIAACALLVSAFLIFLMKPDKLYPKHSKFTLRKEYGLFYWLNILYGTRKQIFLTFAPWVLVTIFNKDTAMVATLLTIGGVIGIVFNPLLGRAIDRFGERRILMTEAAVLFAVCIGYGFSRMVFGETIAFYIAACCFIADQLLMSVSMARATYLKKIAVRPEDVTQTLTMGVTIDHFFSIGIALVSGLIWTKLGYQYVFLIAAVIAVVNFFSASRIRIN
ncbi:MAG: MFS transporter [Spirochaetes bacterium]|nr:MFS transporter [Spirochaetota bacterium]